MLRLFPRLPTLALLFIPIAFPPFLMSNEPTNIHEGGVDQKARDRRVEEKYAAWVATLDPARKAWEETLQRRLGETFGGYYLPLYKKEKAEGVPTAWDYVEDDPRLPRVLLIGDSISRGYTITVRHGLAGKANVHRAPENCGAAKNGVAMLEQWLGDGNWQVIHFNFGLHDYKTPPEVYESELREIVARLKRTGAHLIWATTTPRPLDTPEGEPAVKIDAEHRATAARIMAENGIDVDDLFEVVKPRLAEFQKPKDVHFDDNGYQFLGCAVAVAIEKALVQPQETRAHAGHAAR